MANGNKVQTWQCLTNVNQAWIWGSGLNFGEQIVFGKAKSPEYCLNVVGNRFVAGNRVYLWQCNAANVGNVFKAY